VSVTIRDVAREAGVSVATVSRVFNDSGPVRAETRRRIREVAGRLRFSPDGAARSLITRRTTTLGVLLPDLYGEFFSEVIRGIDRTAQRHGYHLLVSGSHNDRSEIEAALRAMRGRVDGLLVMTPDVDGPALVANLPESLPAVLLNCRAAGPTFDAINIDNYGGARAMVRHLLALGHRRVGIVRGPARNHDARERLRGYHAALRAAGALIDPALEAAGDFTEAAGYAGAAALLDAPRGRRPTAVFAANDAMAVGALSALRERGVRVPGEVAVAGFDDIPIARYTSPPLTTVRVAIPELGARGTETLLRAIASKNAHERRHETLPTTLVVRRSCGAFARGAAGADGGGATVEAHRERVGARGMGDHAAGRGR
jgi:LacI family transcriptional regulator